jgi:small-conductance mechanosensitive channel
MPPRTFQTFQLRSTIAMAGIIQWLIFLHVLGAISFFLFHGASAAMAFKIRKETDFARIGAMLDLSASTLTGMGISFAVMGLTGLAMPFVLHIWSRGYIWVSIVLMVGVVAHMSVSTPNHYPQVRRLIGQPYVVRGKQFPAEPPSSPAEVQALLQKHSVVGLVMSGYVVPAIVLWLMIFKPF